MKALEKVDITEDERQILEDRFCKLVSSGMDPAKAYVEAGHPGPCGMKAVIAANKLMEQEEIKAKITSLKVEVGPVNKNKVLDELWSNFQQASASGEYAAANRALELIGKQQGMFIERKKIEFTKKIEELSDEELMMLAGGEDVPNTVVH